MTDDAVPKPAAIDPTLDENSIAALIEFFKLLDKWDKSKGGSSSWNSNSSES